MLQRGDQKGEIQLEDNQTGTDKTGTQVRSRTLVAHESRYVGVTLRMVNWPGKDKEMRMRVPRISRLAFSPIYTSV